jgi:release factor glutamine methyltransferase
MSGGMGRFLRYKMYHPAEDSYLMQKHVKKYSKVDSVLDIGTGTGIQAITAAKNAKKVVAVDIDPESLKYAKKQASGLKNIIFKKSDLFENIKEKFDLILFNPPYLPDKEKIEDKELVSGKTGTDLTIRFLDKATNFLEKEGIILLIASSLSSSAKINEAIEKHLFEKKELEKIHVFFEDIILLKLNKSEILKKLEYEKIKDPKIFAHGKRGVIIKGIYKNKTVGIKIKKKESFAFGTIDNEARFLKILNKENIGPILIMHKENFLMYEFVNGIFIEEFVMKSKKKDIIILLKKIFKKMYLLDSIGINKFEMHHPVKHIIIKDNNPVLLDFERCRRTDDPKNVTQFCDFLISKTFNDMLKEKGLFIEKNQMIESAKKYKEKINKKNFNNILSLL